MMSTQTTPGFTDARLSAPATAEKEEALEKMAAAYGLSAAATIVFNTLLAWAKDSYEPLNSVMAAMSGHHWRTHSLVDVIVFFVLGWVFMSRGTAAHLTNRLIFGVAAAAVVAGAGLVGWFLVA
jgi:hypothetical protein